MRLPRWLRTSIKHLVLVAILLILVVGYVNLPKLKSLNLFNSKAKFNVHKCDGCNKVNRDLLVLPRLENSGAGNDTRMPANTKRLLVIVTSSYRNTERRAAIRETWASVRRVSVMATNELVSNEVPIDIEIHTLFVIGGGGLPASALTALRKEGRENGDLLVTTYSDSYASLTMQILSAFQFLAGATQQFIASDDKYRASRFSKLSWVFKCDDDAYVNLNFLLRQAVPLEDSQEPAMIVGHVLSGIRALRIVSNSRLPMNLKVQPNFGAQAEQIRKAAVPEAQDSANSDSGVGKAGQLPFVADVDKAADKTESLEYRFGPDEPYPPFASGSAYLMNDAAFRRLVAVMRDVPPYRLDDVYVTGLLREAASSDSNVNSATPIRIIGKSEFLLVENKRFGLSACDYAEWIIASHPVNVEELRGIWEALHSIDTIRKCSVRLSSGWSIKPLQYRLLVPLLFFVLILLCFKTRRASFLLRSLIRFVVTLVSHRGVNVRP